MDSGDCGLLGMYEEHVALGTEPLFYHYQPEFSGKLKSSEPFCQMILIELQQFFLVVVVI